MGCIGDYFRREWTQPALYNISPLVREYEQVPAAITELKEKIMQKYSIQNRLTAVLLATSIVSASTNPARLLVASGRIVGAFAGLSFIALPEVSSNFAS
jgi:hypothetical protein